LTIEPYIAVKDIHKSFGDAEVLKGISFDIAKSEAVCIIGPSGSGKSTLLRCLNGLATIDRGSIRIGTHNVHEIKTDQERIALRKDVSMVFQQYNLFPHKTALENIMMAPVHVLKQDPREVEERAHALLKKVRLAGKEAHYPGELSGGQQQRVAIARSLAMRPSVMLFDEVTSALDPETVKEVLVTIRELVNDGLTCVLVTHEMGFAREVAEHVYFTDQGVIVEHGKPAELFSNPQHARTKAFLDQIL
jgi:polar amino acid transport system ATP-binding protein